MEIARSKVPKWITVESSTGVDDLDLIPDEAYLKELDLIPDEVYMEELAEDERNLERWIGLALADYNGRHGTDYVDTKSESDTTQDMYSCPESKQIMIHIGITVVSSKDGEPKHFCADLEEDTEDVVSSRIGVAVVGVDDDSNSIGCEFCRWAFCPPKPKPKSVREGEGEEFAGISAFYSGQTQYGQGDYKAKFPRLALRYYKKKQGKDYKLADLVSGFVKWDPVSGSSVAHCNFYAREDDDAPKKLFFAELQWPLVGIWVVRCCRVIQGKDNAAGCYHCVGDKGKAVIHPSSGFRFGLYPSPYPESQLAGRGGGRGHCRHPSSDSGTVDTS